MAKAPTDKTISTSSQRPVALADMIRKEGGNDVEDENNASPNKDDTSDTETGTHVEENDDGIGRPGGMKLAIAADDDDEDTPATSEDGDDAELDDVDEAVLSVPKADCLQCSHLVAFAEKAFKRCHYSAGNEACPAKTVTIVMAVPMHIVHNFLRAEKEGDTAKLTRLYAALGQRSPGVQRQVFDALNEAREKAKAR